MFGRVGFVLLWAGFVFYAVVLAPPQQPDTFELIGKLATGQWANINPAIVALFNLMGVWPMIYACLALIDGAEQKLPAWPFVSLSFGVGAFALLPYLALRKPKPEPVNYSEADKTKLIQLVDSPWTGRAIALTSLFLVIYGITQGNWSDFAQQWQTSQFINVMSLDFCMLCAVVAPLVKSDMARRGMDSSVLFWIATLVPLLGVVVYLSVRSPLSQIDSAARPSSPEQSPT
ncbi:MAG: DUF2834 domain-containing protein [Cyanobacteria bacterium J06621_3]